MASFLNVYLHPDSHGATYNLLLLQHLPSDLVFIGGDFNMHHPDWSIPRPDLGFGTHLSRSLVDFMSENSFALATSSLVPTHILHNSHF